MATKTITLNEFGNIKRRLHYRHVSGQNDKGVSYDFLSMSLKREDVVSLMDDLTAMPTAKGFDITLEQDSQSAVGDIMKNIEKAVKTGNIDDLKVMVANYQTSQERIKAARKARNTTPPQPVQGSAPAVVQAKPADASDKDAKTAKKF